MNLAILGAGYIAGTLARTVRLMNEAGNNKVKLTAVASRSLDKARDFARARHIEKAYGSYEEMLRDPSIDAVYVATPHALHAEQMRMCIEHGKAVLCEKAFTGNLRQAEEVLNLAEQKAVLVTEAIWTRYQPMRKIIQGLAFSGIIGEPRMIQANLCYLISHKERIVKPELAGGALLDVGIYPLNFAEMVFGPCDAQLGTAVLTDQGVDETDGIFLKWKDGKTASLSAGTTVLSDREGIIWGTGGFIRIENVNNPQNAWVYNTDRQELQHVPCPVQLTGYEYEIDEFCQTFEAGKIECPSMPHADTLHVMRVMDDLRAQMGVKYPFD